MIRQPLPWFVRVIAVLILAGLAACSGDPPTGPVEIKFGRDTCDFCRMIISDPRFASQVRGGPDHKAFKFDDLGEALVFLSLQPWRDEAGVEIWVMDMTTGKAWLNAREAHYVTVGMSPMGFNYGAIREPRPGSIPFAEFHKKAMSSLAAALCLRQGIAPKANSR